jgi:hypothetical protein
VKKSAQNQVIPSHWCARSPVFSILPFKPSHARFVSRSRQREERESVRVALKRGGEQTAVRRHGDRRDGRVAAAREIQNMVEYACEINVRNGAYEAEKDAERTGESDEENIK